jgi:hypothetical protein
MLVLSPCQSALFLAYTVYVYVFHYFLLFCNIAVNLYKLYV